jgi:hypothetical protein
LFIIEASIIEEGHKRVVSSACEIDSFELQKNKNEVNEQLRLPVHSVIQAFTSTVHHQFLAYTIIDIYTPTRQVHIDKEAHCAISCTDRKITRQFNRVLTS